MASSLKNKLPLSSLFAVPLALAALAFRGILILTFGTTMLNIAKLMTWIF